MQAYTKNSVLSKDEDEQNGLSRGPITETQVPRVTIENLVDLADVSNAIGARADGGAGELVVSIGRTSDPECGDNQSLVQTEGAAPVAVGNSPGGSPDEASVAIESKPGAGEGEPVTQSAQAPTQVRAEACAALPQKPKRSRASSKGSPIFDLTAGEAPVEDAPVAQYASGADAAQPTEHLAAEIGLTLTIDPEFEALCPRLTDEEERRLRVGLERDGQLSPLNVWKHDGENILVDGHTRHRILKALGKTDIRTVEVRFGNREDAIDWIIMNQLGRRNLHPMAATLLLGKLYNARKGRQGGDRAKDHSDPLLNTAAAIAKETCRSTATVKRAGRLAEAAQKEGVEEKIIAGTEKRSQKEIVAAACPSKKNDEPASEPASESASEPILKTDAERRLEDERYKSSSVYPAAQKIIKEIEDTDWHAVPCEVAVRAKKDIENALHGPAWYKCASRY